MRRRISPSTPLASSSWPLHTQNDPMPSPPEYSTLPEVVETPRDGPPKRDCRPPVPPKPSHFKRPSAPSLLVPPPKPQLAQPQSQVPTLCCVCNCSKKAWKCVQCDDFFCDACWPLERPHRVSTIFSLHLLNVVRLPPPLYTYVALKNRLITLHLISTANMMNCSQEKLGSMAVNTKRSTRRSSIG